MEIKTLNVIKYQKFSAFHLSFSLTLCTKGTNSEIKMYKNYLDKYNTENDKITKTVKKKYFKILYNSTYLYVF